MERKQHFWVCGGCSTEVGKRATTLKQQLQMSYCLVCGSVTAWTRKL